jgi:hypothetical protein
MKKSSMEYSRHYINKYHTRQYYMGMTFTNKEWDDFIHDKTVQGIKIPLLSKYRKPPEHCDRWYHQNKPDPKIVEPCPNKPFYRDSQGLYFCKYCAREVNKINNHVVFNRINK